MWAPRSCLLYTWRTRSTDTLSAYAYTVGSLNGACSTRGIQGRSPGITRGCIHFKHFEATYTISTSTLTVFFRTLPRDDYPVFFLATYNFCSFEPTVIPLTSISILRLLHDPTTGRSQSTLHPRTALRCAKPPQEVFLTAKWMDVIISIIQQKPVKLSNTRRQCRN